MIFRLILLSVFCTLPFSLNAAEVRVLAAASLKGVIAELATTFEERYSQHRVLISSASSGTLARQIAAGAPADLFLSANPSWMSHLVEKDKVATGQPVDWASNHLVVVGRGEQLSSLDDLKGFSRTAIGSPESAPVGRYARDMLQRAGLYDRLKKNRRFVLGKDVWQILLYAEQGAVNVSILYASDSLLCKKAKVLLVPDERWQPQIRYPITLTKTGREKTAAKDFFNYLLEAGSADILTRYGFRPLVVSEKG